MATKPPVILNRAPLAKTGAVEFANPLDPTGRAAPPAQFVGRKGGDTPTFPWLPQSPHNIPSQRQRPAKVGYNDVTPVVHIAGGSPIGSRVRRAGAPALPQELADTLQSIFNAHHYAKVIEQSVSVTNTAGGQLILAEPDSRRNLLAFRNDSAAANIYIAFGATPSALSVLRIIPDQLMLFDTVVPQDDVFAWADAASGVLAFQYSNVNF